jgi:hypothetical protein
MNINSVMGGIDLQKTLASSSATDDSPPRPHHPIVCGDRIFLYEDGRFACLHSEVSADDVRTRACLDHSIAVLLFEELYRRQF